MTSGGRGLEPGRRVAVVESIYQVCIYSVAGVGGIESVGVYWMTDTER